MLLQTLTPTARRTSRHAKTKADFHWWSPVTVLSLLAAEETVYQVLYAMALEEKGTLAHERDWFIARTYEVLEEMTAQRPYNVYDWLLRNCPDPEADCAVLAAQVTNYFSAFPCPYCKTRTPTTQQTCINCGGPAYPF